jgi:hypothetical protein
VFDPDGRFIRNVTLIDSPLSVLFLSDGSFLGVKMQPTASEPGRSLRQYNATGALKRALADTPVEDFQPRNIESLYRTLAHAQDGGVWVAHARQAIFERRSANADLMNRVVAKDHWVATTSNARIAGISEDSAGFLWVTSIRPDDRAGVRRPDPSKGPESTKRSATLSDAVDFVDSVIEAFDPKSGRVLASLRADEVYAPIPGSNLLLRTTSSAAGDDVVELFRAVLVRPTTTPKRTNQ